MSSNDDFTRSSNSNRVINVSSHDTAASDDRHLRIDDEDYSENDDDVMRRCTDRRTNSALFQNILYCCGTEGRTMKTAVRICLVENAVHFICLWFALFILLLAILISSSVHIWTQNRHFQVIPYDGYNETTIYEFDNEELVYFLQISDLHLSANVPHVYERFEQFLSVDLNVIAPRFVFVTGDITDQIMETGYFNPISPSNHEPNQWKRYSALLKKHLVPSSRFSPDFWIDFRGNHDNYEVPDLHSPFNLFVNYSVSALRPDPYARVINFTYRTRRNSTYSFVAFDACPSVGMSSPMNFYGLITDEIVSQLKDQVNITREHNHTILMSHYPLSTVNIAEHPLRNGRKKLEDEILDEWRPTAYLSGHLHLAHLHDSNNFMLDLELGDFMFNNYYRLLAFDNDIFSFVDTKLGKWPLILVTNPKNDKHLSQKDKWQRMKRSRHIRALLFSPSNITNIEIHIDHRPIVSMRDGIVCVGSVLRRQIDSPLFEFDWDPSKYDDNRSHHFRIRVKDERNVERTEEFQFHLGGKARRLGTLYSNTVLTVNMQALFLIVFIIFYSYAILMCLVIPKIIYIVLSVMDQKYYRLFRRKIKRNVYELCGAMELVQEIAEHETLPVIATNDLIPRSTRTPRSPETTVNQQRRNTMDSQQITGQPDIVPANASSSNSQTETTALIRKTQSSTNQVVELQSDKESIYVKCKRRVRMAQLFMWQCIIDSFLWHTWKYMQISNRWSLLLLVTGVYFPVGPIFYGPLIQHRWGINYMWGIYVYGRTLHTFGALIYAFPLVLFIYIPTVMLCTAHNDMMRLNMKLHFAQSMKTSQRVVILSAREDYSMIDDESTHGTTTRQKSAWRRMWDMLVDRYHFLRLALSTTLLSCVILVGGGLLSYAHLQFYGANSYFSAPSIFYLWILSLVRICSVFTTSYNYFSKCRGDERRRWIIS